MISQLESSEDGGDLAVGFWGVSGAGRLVEALDLERTWDWFGSAGLGPASV